MVSTFTTTLIQPRVPGSKDSSPPELSLMAWWTAEALPKSNLMNSPDLLNVTGSQASRAGHWLLRLPGFQPQPGCGPVAAPASPSVPQASAAAPMTSATSGLPSCVSSSPVSHPSCSESRSPARMLSDQLQEKVNSLLMDRLSKCGSMEYSLISKEHLTPAQRRIFRLRASAHRTSARDSGGVPIGWPTESANNHTGPGAHGEGGDNLQTMAGWATPTTRDHKDTTGMATTGTNPDGSERSRLDQLGRQVGLIAGWPTPMAGTPAQNGNNMAGNNDSSRKTMELVSGWPTPTVGNAMGSQMAKDASSTGRRPDGSKATVSLNHVATLAGWATPTANEPGGTAEAGLARKRKAVANGIKMGCESVTILSHQVQLASPDNPNSSYARMGSTEGFQLNPHFSLNLMRYPAIWGLIGMISLRKFRLKS